MKRKAYGRDAGLTLRMLLHWLPARAALRLLRARALLRAERRPRLDARDRRWAGASFQYFTSDKLALRGLGGEGRRARRGARAARHDRAARGAGRPAQAARGDHRVRRPERIRDRPEPEARCRRRHDRPLEPARAAGGRGRARARALAHRQPRRARDDRGELLRDGRRPADPLSGSTRGMFGGFGGNRDNNNSGAGLADRRGRLGRHLLPQPDPDSRASRATASSPPTAARR